MQPHPTGYDPQQDNALALQHIADARLALALVTACPALSGVALHGGGPARDALLRELTAALPPGAPVRRLPAGIDEEGLSGGLDLAATLASGRPVRRPGLLDEVSGGLLVIPMAERLEPGVAARIAQALDEGGIAGAPTFRIAALDDGDHADDGSERLPSAIADRLAFSLSLAGIDAMAARAAGLLGEEMPGTAHLAEGTGDMACAIPSADETAACEAIAALTLALGVDSPRAARFALLAARTHAALEGRDSIAQDDIAVAARLVLAPRATRLPLPETSPEDLPPAEPPPPEDRKDDPAADDGDQREQDLQPPDDIVLEAVLASLPRDLLQRIADANRRSRAQARARGKGEKQRSALRGRPRGSLAGLPRGGRRLSLIDTLRAAAPWQKLRAAGLESVAHDGDMPAIARIRIRRDDLRIRRYESRKQAITIFAVDASGSSAMARLAEAKGAVELLLAQAYVKRAQVALIAFRGHGAELLLPPTRSLTRARRSLADLPGGGGTPLAAGLEAARALAVAAQARGQTPFVVILTDGRGNVAADGGTVRETAEADAMAAARAIGAAGLKGAFVDISARPRPEGALLAAATGLRYLPLPRADARAMHAAIERSQAA